MSGLRLNRTFNTWDGNHYNARELKHGMLSNPPSNSHVTFEYKVKVKLGRLCYDNVPSEVSCLC